VRAMDSDLIFQEDTFIPMGMYFQANVPDTLDLAERAKLSVHGLTSFLNPESTKPPARYGPFGHSYFNADPPYMSDMPGGPPNWGKISESLLLARVMSGSRENMAVDSKTFQGMIQYISLDPKAPTPLSRVMLAMIDLYQIAPRPEFKKLIDQMAQLHREAARHKGDLAYYSGPLEDNADSMLGVIGHGWTPFIQGCAIRPLARWGSLGADPGSLALAGQVSAYLMQPDFWKSEGEPKAVYGPDHAHFSGHLHSYTQGLMGLLWYADATRNGRIKEFVREGYEYCRNFGLARLGLFGEGCATGDMTWLALKLSDAGIGDYYEDADCYARNHLAELQLTDEDKLRRTVQQMPKNVRGKNEMAKPEQPFDAVNETRDSVVSRNVGVFLSDATHPTLVPESCCLYTICCTGNCTPAMYYAWESIVRCQNGAAQVNLLLNRASGWLDIDSFLPYEGKVVIRNKSAKSIAVRIPRWVDKNALVSRSSGREAKAYWVGQYLVFNNVKPHDALTITFPVVETTEKYTLKWKQAEFWKESTNPGNTWRPLTNPPIYTCTFRGNTLVDISPHERGQGYALYEREELKHQTNAPIKAVTRYVAPVAPKL
jgi:hypothetical protein